MEKTMNPGGQIPIQVPLIGQRPNQQQTAFLELLPIVTQAHYARARERDSAFSADANAVPDPREIAGEVDAIAVAAIYQLTGAMIEKAQ
jgi:hypothetical protein